ncbi:30S ribosome-binding factor RbfA [Mycoplasma leonicaptivi]|uniref:30S ribosome-binding factor RbfA n=1 Tax=Mycoplasma leonicaptivi TaxID=36742 RepID=UPI00048761EA|nr:30S ribosome-binding factor RbfA [Mycoplasma leonicaptivi]
MNEIALRKKETVLHNLLSKIIFENINNSNINNVTIIDVKLTSDLSFVKVFVSIDSNENKGIIALNNASGFIRSILSKSLDWRKVPKVIFELDQVSKTGLKIDELIKQIQNEK